MQLEVVYYRPRGFWKYLFLGKATGTAILLKSSNSFFCRFGNSFHLLKHHLFMKSYEILDIQELPVDYDIYVKVAQTCMTKMGLDCKEFSLAELTGSKQIYKTLVEGLKLDQDYTHIKELTSKEISKLTPKKVHKYFSYVISTLPLTS